MEANNSYDKELRQELEGIRDERGTHKNTAWRVGSALLDLYRLVRYRAADLTELVKELRGEFLSRRSDDSAEGRITFLKGLVSKAASYFRDNVFIEGLLTVKNAVIDVLKSGNYSGEGVSDSGWRLTNDDGSGYSKLTIDKLYVRVKAVFEALEVKKWEVSGGNHILSCAANRVVRTDYFSSDVPPTTEDGEGSAVYDRQTDYAENLLGYSTMKVPWLLRGLPQLLGVLGLDGERIRHLIASPRTVRLTLARGDLSLVRRARCYFLASDGDRATENWWKSGDLALCREMNIDTASGRRGRSYLPIELLPGNWYWWRRVVGASSSPVTLGDGKQYHWFDVAFRPSDEGYAVDALRGVVVPPTTVPSPRPSWCASGSDFPMSGDDVVQLGHVSDPDRMNAIVLEVNGGSTLGSSRYNGRMIAPAVRAYMGIYKFDLTRSWWGGQCERMTLSPSAGYRLYGPMFELVTEDSVERVPVNRGAWLNIVEETDWNYMVEVAAGDDEETEDGGDGVNAAEGEADDPAYAPRLVRKCRYYDLVTHNGSAWLCVVPEVWQWQVPDSEGHYHVVSDADYSSLVAESESSVAEDATAEELEAHAAAVAGVAGAVRERQYTIDEPGEGSADWELYVGRGADGKTTDRVTYFQATGVQVAPAVPAGANDETTGEAITDTDAESGEVIIRRPGSESAWKLNRSATPFGSTVGGVFYKYLYAQELELRSDGHAWWGEVYLANVAGSDGQDGQNGIDGHNGVDGADGQDGADGEDGEDGQDAFIVITSPASPLLFTQGMPTVNAQHELVVGDGANLSSLNQQVRVMVRCGDALCDISNLTVDVQTNCTCGATVVRESSTCRYFTISSISHANGGEGEVLPIYANNGSVGISVTFIAPDGEGHTLSHTIPFYVNTAGKFYEKTIGDMKYWYATKQEYSALDGEVVTLKSSLGSYRNSSEGSLTILEQIWHDITAVGLSAWTRSEQATYESLVTLHQSWLREQWGKNLWGGSIHGWHYGDDSDAEAHASFASEVTAMEYSAANALYSPRVRLIAGSVYIVSWYGNQALDTSVYIDRYDTAAGGTSTPFGDSGSGGTLQKVTLQNELPVGGDSLDRYYCVFRIVTTGWYEFRFETVGSASDYVLLRPQVEEGQYELWNGVAGLYKNYDYPVVVDSQSGAETVVAQGDVELGVTYATHTQAPTAYDGDSLSVQSYFFQTARRITMAIVDGLKRTGIDISGNKIRLQADKVEIVDSQGHANTSTHWIDAQNGSLHAIAAPWVKFQEVDTAGESSVSLEAEAGTIIYLYGPGAGETCDVYLPSFPASYGIRLEIRFPEGSRNPSGSLRLRPNPNYAGSILTHNSFYPGPYSRIDMEEGDYVKLFGVAIAENGSARIIWRVESISDFNNLKAS